MRNAADDIIVRRKTDATIDANGEGIWTPVVTDTHYRGSVHQRVAEEGQPDILGQYGERKRLVVRIPNNAIVESNDQIIIENNYPFFNGTYVIEGIINTRTHLRLLLRRTVGNE
jgi:hypothetical protein